MKSKVWSSQSIRALARKKWLQEAPPAESQESAPAPNENETLSPKFEFEFGRFEKAKGEKVIVVHPYKNAKSGSAHSESERDLEEMVSLCKTLGLDVVQKKSLALRSGPTAKTFITLGLLENLGQELKAVQGVALVVDAPLTPGQIKNIEKIIEAPVLDREGVILAIFQRHAQTSLAKMQVELARLKYLQPRLSGLWMGLSRQSGGKGGQGGRGLGETRLELDRRTIKDRISALSKKLKDAEKHFKTRSQSRSQLPRVALVGYTNAGKSTLMNRLTHADVLRSPKLFATLDTTVRQMVPPTQPPVLVSDTVGFVKNLPHDFVASFKSTLKEAIDCPLLLLVLDASSDRVKLDFEVTRSVLEEIGLKDQGLIVVLNKVDLIPESLIKIRLFDLKKYFGKLYPGVPVVPTSSVGQGQGLDLLKQNIKEFFHVSEPSWTQFDKGLENNENQR